MPTAPNPETLVGQQIMLTFHNYEPHLYEVVEMTLGKIEPQWVMTLQRIDGEPDDTETLAEQILREVLLPPSRMSITLNRKTMT